MPRSVSGTALGKGRLAGVASGLLQKEVPPSPPEKEAPSSVPEESPCSRPKKAATSLTLPPVDYLPQDAPTPSVWEIRKKLEAQLSSLAEQYKWCFCVFIRSVVK